MSKKIVILGVALSIPIFITAVILLAVLVVGILFGYPKYQAIYAPNVPSDLTNPYLHIPSESTFDDLVELLDKEGFIKNKAYFVSTAKLMKFNKRKMRGGRFEIKPNWNNRELIKHLRTGRQSPLNVILTHAWLPENVAAKAATFIEADSAEIVAAFQDPALLAKYDITPETLMSYLIPNTYEMYWNTDAKAFLERMVKEHDRFWTSERLAKADALGLSPTQVYTLASIVERETRQTIEKPKVAGVYLNRLKINMLLQADPTLKFATKDFAARRLYDYHKQVDSKYNTYMYTGLPPGPISMASITSIEAVLSPASHDYYYFCARPDDSGLHAFAKSLAGHNVNVARYRQYQRENKIR